MANIHRIGDLDNQQDNYHNIRGNQQMITMFGGIDEDPRGENFFDMIKKSFCPKLKFQSFTTLICLVITILYITMLLVGGVNKNFRFLGVQQNTLNNFGGNNPYDVKHSFTIYEWFMSLLLIADFYYYIIAIFLIFIEYSLLEASQGYIIAAIVYFGSGIMGALFGDLCNLNNNIAYSETFASIYGCVGFLIGYVILYWQKFDHLGDMKCVIVCFIAMIIIFVLMFTLGSGQQTFYDDLGQLGGFLGGMFIALSFVQVPQSGGYELTCQKVGYGFLGLQIGLSIILLYSL